MRRHGLSLAGLVAIAVLIAGPSPARAADALTTPSDPAAGLPRPSPVAPVIFRVKELDRRPPTFAITARQAIRIADRTKAVRRQRSIRPLKAIPYISPLQLRQGTFYHWDISYVSGDRTYAEVELGRTGVVFEVVEGIDVGWPLVRGYPGVLGDKLNSPYIWVPLCILFLLPFLDPRQPFRLLHLDLLVLLAFGISQYFFTRGEPGISVPLVYPVLAYIVVRLLLGVARPRHREGSLIPLVRTSGLAVAVVVLLAMRVAFNIAESSTFDVSFAGVIGADRVAHGKELYVDNDLHPDTYGPINYIAYVPFELALPYDQEVGSRLAAAQAATLSFDLLMVLGLLMLARRARPGPQGTRLGVALAYAWVAYPYTTLVLGSNTNDALVPLFVVYGLLAASSPWGRGLMLALATMAKFVPVLLAPAFATGLRGLRRREAVMFGLAFVGACVVILVPFIPDGGLREFWKTTIGFQLDRESPLSIWDRHPTLEWLQTLLKIWLLVLVAVTAFRPRRRTVAQLAGISGAIFASAQLIASYWFYFYAVWIAPFALLMLFSEYRQLGPESSQANKVLRKAREPVHA